MKVEEHTAQIESGRAAEIQEQFIEGRINALSCSTTFELGVDVGEVQAVLMRNMPPTAANYVQRSGRAGRRLGSPALIVTYAQRRSHDLFFFQSPKQMIDGAVATPIISVANPLIVRRHLHAAAFVAFEREHVEKGGEWHRKVEDFFSSDEGIPPVEEFIKWLRTEPDGLLKTARSITPDKLHDELGIESFEWVNALIDDDANSEQGWLTRATQDAQGGQNEINEEIGRVQEEIKELTSANLLTKAQAKIRYQTALVYQLSTLNTRPLINFLAQRVVLPKYGFPVDVVPLDVSATGDREASRVDLNRDLKLAITDFAPGARIVANNSIWEPQGLRVPPGRSLLTYTWAVCSNCDTFRSKLGVEAGQCGVCSETEASETSQYVTPLFGFIGQKSDEPPGDSRPPRAGFSNFYFNDYMSDEPPKFEPVSSGSVDVNLRFSRHGQITVVNKGPSSRGFRVCFQCGYAEAMPTRVSKKKRSNKPPAPHKKPGRRQTECNNMLSSRQLGHQFLTDVVEVVLPISMEYEGAVSTLAALLTGTKGLGISRDDVNGMVRPMGNQQWSLVLFDNVPGGAGHVLRIRERFAELVVRALDAVQRCECGEDASCYGCLRVYANQTHHDKLTRRAALGVLSQL
jgi:hypothetical protein